MSSRVETACEVGRRASRRRVAGAALTGLASFVLVVHLGGQTVSEEQERVYQRYLNLAALIEGTVDDVRWLPDNGRLRFTVSRGSEVEHYEFDPQTRARTRLETPDGDVPDQGAGPDDLSAPRQVGRGPFGFPLIEIGSPDGRWFAHRRDHDLWLRPPDSEALVRLTDDGEETYFWGTAFEWDVDYGRPWAWWSPDGTRLAVKKHDDRSVLDVPWLRYRDGEVVIDRRPLAGSTEPWPSIELHIFGVPGGDRVRVDDGGDPEQHMFVLGWSEDGAELRYMTLDPQHKLLRLMGADAATGRTRVILAERRDTIHDPLWSQPPWFTPVSGGDQFVWTSDQDGWRHIYLHDMAGTLVRRLTRGPFPVHEVMAVDEEAGWVYFTAHTDLARPYDLHFARVRLDGTGFVQLTDAPGVHQISLSPSHDFFVDTYSTIDSPPVTAVRRVDGTLVDTLAVTDVARLTETGWTAPEEIVVTASDGQTELHGVLYKPFDFDPDRRYPVIEYIYDGFNTTVVARTFPGPGYSGPAQGYPLDGVDPIALAQLGYLVWVVDGRGTAERGRAFRDVIFEEGFDAIEEHVQALRQVARDRPYVDLDRVGIFGLSAGGLLTLRAMFEAPEFYRVGVVLGGPVDSPEAARDLGPAKGPTASIPRRPILANVGRLEGQLLLVYATDDPVVPMSNALRLIEALIAVDRPHDLLLLPGQEHLFTGDAAEYARDVVRRYFLEHLARPPS